MYHVRLLAQSALILCALLSTLDAAEADKTRFQETTKKLIDAINANDTTAIENMFAAEMQQALPAEKATPFFRGIVAAHGKLKTAGSPAINGPTATMKVTAERGAWDFKITLDDSDK